MQDTDQVTIDRPTIDAEQPAGGHWLHTWLTEADADATSGAGSAAPRREFVEPPEVVVAALVHVLSTQAHLVGFEGYGTTILFRQRGTLSRRHLVAEVRVEEGHSVLEIGCQEAPLETLQQRRAEREVVDRILDTVGWRLRSARSPGATSVPEQPEYA